MVNYSTKLVGTITLSETTGVPLIRCGFETYPLRLEEVNLIDNKLCNDVKPFVGKKVDFNLINGFYGPDPINVSILDAVVKKPTEEKLDALVLKFNKR